MKRLLCFDWARRHKAATVVLVIVAAWVFVYWMIRGTTDSQSRYISAVAERKNAETLLESRKIAASDRLCRHAVDILTELAARSRDPRIRFEQAAAFETLAMIQSAADQPDEADVCYHRAVDVWSRLLGDDQRAVDVRWRLARCLARRAPLLSDAGRWEEAEQTLKRGTIVCRTRIPGAPSDGRVDRQLVSITNQLGLLFLRIGRSEPALTTFESAVQAARKLIGTPASTAEAHELLISSLVNQARTCSALRQGDAAIRLYREARELAEGLSSASGASARYRDLVAALLEAESNELKRDSGRAAEARGLLERAIAVRESLADVSPVERDYLDLVAQACSALADSFLDAHSYEEAEKYERKALSYALRLTNLHPEVRAFEFGRGQAMHNLAELLRQRGRAAEALPLEREAAPLLARVHRENVLDEGHRRAASYAYWTLCTLELDRKDHRAAAQSVSAYQSIEPNGYEEAHEAAGLLCRCVLLCRDDHDSLAADKESLARAYADRAIGALETAVRYGFRDLNELTTSQVYEPIRARPEFSRLVHEVEGIVEAVKEG
jgi:tetratricopeptide (TPR) repeat protein